MKNIFYKYSMMIAAFLAVSILPTSCIEEQESEIEGKGKSFFRLRADAGFYLASFDAKVGTYDLMDVLRDVNSSAAMQSAASITYQIDDSIVEDYNEGLGEDEQDLAYTILDQSTYSLIGSSIDFAAGEFSKTIQLQLDPSTLDYSKRYAIGLTLANPPAGYLLSAANGAALIEVIVKNAYHGTYKSAGYFTHPNPTSSRDIAREKELATIGANAVRTELADLGGSGYEMDLIVNADNTVTIKGYIDGDEIPIKQAYQVNKYDPATGKFDLKYSYNATAPRIINEVLTPK